MCANWWDWGDLAVSVRRLRRQHPHDDGCDVVVSSVHVRFLNEGVDDSLGLGARHQQLLNAPVFDHPRQPIAREEKRVTDMCCTVEHVRLYLVRHSDAAGDDLALRMPSRLLRSHKTCIDLFLYQ